MDKKEFFAILRESLEGYVPKEEVEKNISYYQDYFHESELSEKEVLEELGDPRLLARTVNTVKNIPVLMKKSIGKRREKISSEE